MTNSLNWNLPSNQCFAIFSVSYSDLYKYYCIYTVRDQSSLFYHKYIWGGGLLDIYVSIVSSMELEFYEHHVTEVRAADSSHLVSLESRGCVGLKGAFSFNNSNLTFRTHLGH